MDDPTPRTPGWAHLHTNLLAHVASFMPVDVFLSTRAICKAWRQVYATLRTDRRFLTKRLLAGLSRRGIGPVFLAAVQADHAVLSGGLILSILLGETWAATDVDVFKRGEPNVFGAVEDLLWKAIGADEHCFSLQCYNAIPKLSILREYRGVILDGDGDGGREQENKDKDREQEDRDRALWTVQVINVTEEPVQFIDTTFDLDFCKITFDGQKLLIHDVTALAARTSTYRHNTAEPLDQRRYRATYLKRCRKYMARGFRIPNLTERLVPIAGYTDQKARVIAIANLDVDAMIPRSVAESLLHPQVPIDSAEVSVAELCHRAQRVSQWNTSESIQLRFRAAFGYPDRAHIPWATWHRCGWVHHPDL